MLTGFVVYGSLVLLWLLICLWLLWVIVVRWLCWCLVGFPGWCFWEVVDGGLCCRVLVCVVVWCVLVRCLGSCVFVWGWYWCYVNSVVHCYLRAGVDMSL